jgi:hypothetical protein
VIPVVVGSSPISHPTNTEQKAYASNGRHRGRFRLVPGSSFCLKHCQQRRRGHELAVWV